MPQSGSISARGPADLRELPHPAARLRDAAGGPDLTRGPVPAARSAPRRSPLDLATLLQVAAALLWIPQAGLLAASIGRISEGAGPSEVLPAAAGVLGLGVARSLLEAAGVRRAFLAARRAVSRERARAVEALATGSPLDITRPASGLAASTIAEQADALVPYLARFQPARLKATLVPLAILACVLPLSWIAALILAVAMPLIPLFMALVGWRAKAASEAQLVEIGGMNAFLLDRLRGLAAIRALGAVDATARRLRASAEDLRRRTMAVLRIAFLSSAVLELFSALGVAMVAVYVGFHLLGQIPFGSWSGRLSLAEGLFILMLAPAFFEPLRDLSAVWHDRAAGEAARDALTRLGARQRDLPGALDDAGPTASSAPTPPVLRIEGLSFRHAGQAAPVFDSFDLTVAPGEHVALFAPSGSGKSTLLALLAGLSTPEGGRIVIAGQDLTPATAAGLRRRIAWIGQNPHIFAGTLAGNVRLGRADIDRADVDRALGTARLGDLAARRGAAPIGEAGLGLSGGEALRLAIARIAATPSADLILADEPTAHLDAATAHDVTDMLVSLAQGKTLIIATHDPDLAARMDRIVRLGPATPETVP